MPESTAPLALIGVPLELGAGRRGCAMGPAALRTAEIAETLTELGRRVEDLGDMAPPPPLGGDHALAMGSTHAAASHWRERNRELSVLWLDAHADFNTPGSSPSGNMHGMPVAMLTGEPGLETLLGDIERVAIDPKNVTLFGIRSVDREERALLRRRGMNVVDMRRIDEFGVVAPLRTILDETRARGGVLHVSLDVDFLDPSIAPGVGTDVPGGATYREAHLIMEMLHDSGLVGSLDIVELNPYLDDRGKSARLLVDLAASLFGRRIVDRES
jgi:arginase